MSAAHPSLWNGAWAGPLPGNTGCKNGPGEVGVPLNLYVALGTPVALPSPTLSLLDRPRLTCILPKEVTSCAPVTRACGRPRSQHWRTVPVGLSTFRCPLPSVTSGGSTHPIKKVVTRAACAPRLADCAFQLRSVSHTDGRRWCCDPPVPATQVGLTLCQEVASFPGAIGQPVLG